MTDIPLRWVGTDATGAAASSVKKNIDSVGKAATGAQGGVKGLTDAMGKMAPAGKTAQGALSGMESAAKSLLGGLGGVAAAMGVGAVVGFGGMMVGAAVEMGKAAESSNRLRAAMEGLATQAGTSGSEIISRLQQASGGAIAEYDLMLAANKAMMLGVASNADDMGKLMEIARVRGSAMGLSLTQAFDDLVTGLGRGSALTLDNLGIMVDAEATNEAYAESIGKTVAQLSEQEKKQALVNATLKEATGAALPAASAYEQMGAGMADLKIAFGELVSPVIVGGVNALSEAVKNLNESIANEKQINIGANLADSAIQFDTVLSTYTTRLEQWKANAAALEAFNGVKIEFPTFEGIPAFDDQLGMAYQSLKGVAERYNETARTMGGALIDIDQLRNGVVAYESVELAIKDVGSANEGATGSISETSQALVDQANKLNLVGGALNDYMSGFDGLMSDMARQEGVVAALSMLDSAEAKVRATVAAYEAMGWSQERIALEVRLLGEDAAASWQQMIDGAERAAGATEAAHGAQMAAGESARGLGIELNFVGDAGFGAKGGIDAASYSAVSAQGSFWGLVDAAAAASEAMRQAQIDSSANRIEGAFLGAVGTLGADKTYEQYQSANAGLELFAHGLEAAGVPLDRQKFLLEEYNTRVSDAIEKQVNAANVQRDNIAAHEMAGRRAAGLGVAAGGATGKLGDLAGKAGDLAGKFQGILDKIPGLKGTSEVSEKQMEDAKLGIPQNFADDYLRRLTDEVLNGVDWAGVDIGDAAQRAGIDPSLPAQTILAMFKNAWADSSLFANPANLDLINMDAVKAGLTQANNAASGKANIDALFGIGDDATIAAVASLGLKVQESLGQWLSENGAPDAGAKLAAALGEGVAAGGIPVDGGLDSWLSSDSGGASVSAFGKALGVRISESTYVTPILLPPKAPDAAEEEVPPSGGGAPTPAFASGTTYFGGGWAKVHKDEVVRLASGPVYNARQSNKFAAATVVVNAVINNKLDEAQFAQMLRSAMRKAQVRS